MGGCSDSREKGQRTLQLSKGGLSFMAEIRFLNR